MSRPRSPGARGSARDRSCADAGRSTSAGERAGGAERIHREQLARLNLLKHVAEQLGQSERTGEIDLLLLGSNSNFASNLRLARSELPEADPDAANEADFRATDEMDVNAADAELERLKDEIDGDAGSKPPSSASTPRCH